jgi:DNA polymerase
MDNKAALFKSLVEEIKRHKCSLRDGCTQAVPGEGSVESSIVFIGEAPGRTEDELGRPFVGAAGKLLAEGLGEIGLTREDVYITNVVKCRPPDNRDPLASEVNEHKYLLEQELSFIKPKLIVLLGRHSLQWFFPNEKISDLRGTAKRQGDKMFFVMYHPAAALYDPRLKETLFGDFKRIPVFLKKIAEMEASLTESETATQEVLL